LKDFCCWEKVPKKENKKRAFKGVAGKSINTNSKTEKKKKKKKKKKTRCFPKRKLN